MRNDASEEDDGNEVDAEQLLAALSGNIPIETTPKKQSKKVTLLLVRLSLAGITDNEDVEKDARFLDEFRKCLTHFKLPLSSLLRVSKLKQLIKMLGQL